MGKTRRILLAVFMLLVFGAVLYTDFPRSGSLMSDSDESVRQEVLPLCYLQVTNSSG